MGVVSCATWTGRCTVLARVVEGLKGDKPAEGTTVWHYKLWSVAVTMAVLAVKATAAATTRKQRRMPS